MNYTSTQQFDDVRPGMDRSSCAWRDALGPGYVGAMSSGVLSVVSRAAERGYCTTRSQ